MTNEEVIAYFQQLKNGTLELEEDENGYVTIPVSNDMFVQNAILYSDQAAGPEETWAYQTNTVEIPMETGIRTFSGATKDEIITQGLMGIMADNLKNMDGSSYAANSLFGKIKRKVEKAMTDAHGVDPTYWTLENVKLPWLYNRIGVYENNKRNYMQGGFTGSGYTEPAWNTSYSTTEDKPFSTAIDLILTEVKNNQFIYSIYFSTNSSGSGTGGVFSRDELGTDINSKISYPLYWCKRVPNSTGKTTFEDIGQYSAWRFQGAVSFGGYDSANECMAHPANEFNQNLTDWETRYRTIRYSEQPYLIGMVLWITDYVPSGTYKYSRFWLIPVAFDFHGNILAPLCTNEPVNLQAETYNGKNFNYKQASPISNLNGNIIVRLSLPMSQAEADYALANNFVIVPVSCLPNDTTYVENGEEPGSGT